MANNLEALKRARLTLRNPRLLLCNLNLLVYRIDTIEHGKQKASAETICDNNPIPLGVQLFSRFNLFGFAENIDADFKQVKLILAHRVKPWVLAAGRDAVSDDLVGNAACHRLNSPDATTQPAMLMQRNKQEGKIPQKIQQSLQVQLEC